MHITKIKKSELQGSPQLVNMGHVTKMMNPLFAIDAFVNIQNSMTRTILSHTFNQHAFNLNTWRSTLVDVNLFFNMEK
jgi:hypothetical protein